MIRMLTVLLSIHATASAREPGLRDLREPVAPPTLDGWRLTFADEFNGPEPGDLDCYDPQITPPRCMQQYGDDGVCPTPQPNLDALNKCNWSVMDRANWMTQSHHVNALHPDAVQVVDGELILHAYRAPAPGQNCHATQAQNKDCDFLSGGLWGRPSTNLRGFAQQHGRFEVRAKLSEGPGSWPAHWMLPEVGPWPGAGEIDIMEMWSWERTKFHGTLHDAGSVTVGGTTYQPHIATGAPMDAGNDAWTSEYHLYAVEWEPSEIRFYIDGIHYQTITDQQLVDAQVKSGNQVIWSGQTPIDVPSGAMHLILNTSITPFNNNGAADPNNPQWSTFAPQSHHIDYVRVYERCALGTQDCDVPETQRRWNGLWNNAGSGAIDWWTLSTDDWLLPGDFDGDGHDELLAIGTNGWSHVMDFGNGWTTQATNFGSGSLHWWRIAPTDHFVVGDYDGDGRDELLAIADNGFSHRMALHNGAWTTTWTNHGGGFLDTWLIAAGDRFRAGDFDGDGRDELLAIGANGWSQRLHFPGVGPAYHSGNGGSGWISTWLLAPSDRLDVIDHDGDGRDELLARAGNQWAQLLSDDGQGLQTSWSNAANDRLALREDAGEALGVAGAFYGSGAEAMLLSRPTTNGREASVIRGHDHGDWAYMIEDAGDLQGWVLRHDDRLLAGDFAGLGKDQLLLVSDAGWAQLMGL